MKKIVPLYNGALFKNTEDGTKVLYYDKPIKIKKNPLFLGFMYETDVYEKSKILINSKKISWQGFIPESIKKKYLNKNEVEYSIKHPDIKKIAKEVLKDNPDPVKVVRRIWSFVRDNMSYKKPKRPNTAAWLLKNKHGRCGEYTRLTISLLRACGLPARGVYGIKNYTDGPAINSHAWAEVYLPDAGWMPVRSQTKLPKGDKYKFEPRYVLKRFRSKYNNKWLTCKLVDDKKSLKRFKNKRKSYHYFIRKRSAKSKAISGITYFIELNENIRDDVFKLFKNINLKLNQKKSLELGESYPVTVRTFYYWVLTASSHKEIANKAVHKFIKSFKQSNVSLKIKRFLKASPKIMKERIQEALIDDE